MHTQLHIEETVSNKRNDDLRPQEDARRYCSTEPMFGEDSLSCGGIVEVTPQKKGQTQVLMQFNKPPVGDNPNLTTGNSIGKSARGVGSQFGIFPQQRPPKGTPRFQKIAMAMGNRYGVDTSGLVATHNSAFPQSLNAEATIQGRHIHFSPGKDTDLVIQHEVAHAIDNALEGTPRGDQMVGGLIVDASREDKVERMVRDSTVCLQHQSFSIQPKYEYPFVSHRSPQKETDNSPEKTSFPRSLQKIQIMDTAPIQRYATSNKGLTVVGEFHDKTDNQRELEEKFVRYVKGTSAKIWKENMLPGSRDGEFSEEPEHLFISGIDRIRFYSGILVEEIKKEEAERTHVSDNVIAVSIKKLNAAFGTISGDCDNALSDKLEVDALKLSLQDMKQNDFVRTINMLEYGEIDENDEISITKNYENFLALLTKLNELATPYFNVTAGRDISHNYIRSKKMNVTANRCKNVNGVWMIGQYHVQEIQEHLRDEVEYNLVSAINFNDDLVEFVQAKKLNITVDRHNDISAATRIVKSSLHYFADLAKNVIGYGKTEGKSHTEFHYDRLADYLYILNDIKEKHRKIGDSEMVTWITAINNKLSFAILAAYTFINRKDHAKKKRALIHMAYIILRKNLLAEVSDLEKLTWTAK